MSKSRLCYLFPQIFGIAVALILKTSSAIPISIGDSLTPRKEINEILHGLKSFTDTPISRSRKIGGGTTTCLRIAPDLPPCNFDSQATWRSTGGEIFHGASAKSAEGRESDYIVPTEFPVRNFDPEIFFEKRDGLPISVNGPRKNFKEIDPFYGNDLSITVVYYLEGCLPSRLPFNLPSCPFEELRRIRMNKLMPFKLPGDVHDVLIFPDIDVKKIKYPRRKIRTRSGFSNHEEIGVQKKESESLSHFTAFGDDHPSLRVNENDSRLGTKGGSSHSTHKLQRTTARKSANPRNGIAITKYDRKLPGSGQLLSSISSESLDEEIIRRDDELLENLPISEKGEKLPEVE